MRRPTQRQMEAAVSRFNDEHPVGSEVMFFSGGVVRPTQERSGMSAQHDYWAEGLSNAAEECGVVMTPEQLAYMADAMAGGHENYGQAFYSPPASDRYNQIERDWKAKYQALEKELEAYRGNAEGAIRRALRLHHDTPVSIDRQGDVYRHGGRSERIL